MPFDPPLTVDELQRELGAQFADFRSLSSGGQGVVYRARHLPTGQDAAVKIYFPEQVDRRTEREIAALRRIRAETLVELIDAGRADLRGESCIYAATRFIEGDVLLEVVSRGPLPVSTVCRCGHDIALAVDALWVERIVHRDIKPGNIMLRRSGGAILIDLGVARHLNLESMTTLGATWGTLGYLSPEQARAVRQLTCKSDLFSLGIVMQEALRGKHPTGRRQDLLEHGGPRTAAVCPGLPPTLNDLIDAMLLRMPNERPAPHDVVATLRSFV